MASPPPVPGRRRHAPLSKATKIGVGLVLTFVGLFLLSVLLPTAPGKFSTLLPVAGAGILLLWMGGIWMGVGSRS
ncbi:MAG TPA: hypothetical protein VN842_04700 [Thermoplasmata archaeon]|nr:hypothetical protein [Thermoplasmata archaeon]